jgi:acetyl esterase/lipase
VKRIAVLFSLLVSISCIIHGGEANDVQMQVWGQYLPERDAQVLETMISVKGAVDSADETPDAVSALMASRTGFIEMAKGYATPFSDLTSIPYDENGLRGSWLTPDDARAKGVLLYLHGGAYVIGSDVTPKSITGFLSREAKIRCFSLDYPLAPEHPFPAAVDNALQAYRMLLEQGNEPNKIVVSGDSAGGGLTLALLLSIREAGLPMPAGAYLISPWTDLTMSFATHSSKASVDMNITAEFLEDSAALYASGQDRTNPLISPAFADLRGFPPILVQVGSHERLLDDSLTIVRNAALADVPTKLSIWPGYPHVFPFFNRNLEGGRRALFEAIDFIISVLNG